MSIGPVGNTQLTAGTEAEARRGIQATWAERVRNITLSHGYDGWNSQQRQSPLATDRNNTTLGPLRYR